MKTEHVADVAAAYIEQHAEQLVQKWIDWLRERVGTTAMIALPERALRNHVPPVLCSLAEYLRNPVQLAREELLGHLRLHAQIRRDQGYSIQEVLCEFDGLAEMVTHGVTRVLQVKADEASTEALLAVSSRLATGLRSVSFITVGTFADSDEERSRGLAAGLEEFTRAVVHELRNPLNTLALTTNILLEQCPDDSQKAHADVMLAAVKRAASLVDTIQMVAIVERGRTGERMVELSDAVTHVSEEYGEEARLAEVDLRIEHCFPAVRVEASLVYILLANLIGNAIKYRDEAKDERWVAVSATLVEEEHDSGFCEIVVRDNGIGIPEDLVPRIFQRGFRAHPETAQGTGLGLFLLRQAVDGRGGDVRIETEVGVGTSFTARIRCLESSVGQDGTNAMAVQRVVGERAIQGEEWDVPGPTGGTQD